MHPRIPIALSGLLVLASAPLVSQASPADRAVNACVQAFVEAQVPKDRIVHVVKDRQSSLMDRFHRQRAYTIALTAQGKQSGKVLAQARCVANVRGEVIVLDSPPPSTYVAQADFVVTTPRFD